MKKTLLLFILSAFSLIRGQAGSAGYALKFDGSGGYAAIAQNDSYNVSKVTIEMWFYYERSNGANVDFLIAKGGEHLEIHTGGGSGTYGLRFIPVTGVYLDTDPNSITQNTWYHVAFCYDPSQSIAKCYINGISKNLTNHGVNPITSPLVATSNEIRLGKRNDNTYPLSGRLDEIRIWNVIRTESEINTYKNLPLTGNETGLIAYYNCNDGSPNLSIIDNSPLHNRGSFVGSVTWVSSEVVLPVELSEFTAHIDRNEVNLYWKTITEVNNNGFEVQRFKNGTWEKVGFIQGFVLSNSPKEYTFKDLLKEPGNYIYRLKQIDADGKVTLSKQIEVAFMMSPSGYRLDQNYPNPFNPSTVIKFEIPENSFVNIDVYNSTGELVSRLLGKQLDKGIHEIEFSNASLTTGVYFYQLRAGKFIAVKKMMFIK